MVQGHAQEKWLVPHIENNKIVEVSIPDLELKQNQYVNRNRNDYVEELLLMLKIHNEFWKISFSKYQKTGSYEWG